MSTETREEISINKNERTATGSGDLNYCHQQKFNNIFNCCFSIPLINLHIIIQHADQYSVLYSCRPSLALEENT